MLSLQWQQPPNDYPTSDGKPMAETDEHRDQMVAIIQMLQRWFSGRDDVYVSGNLLWFYREGDRRCHVSPDVLVRIGTPSGRRNNYLQWLEGGAPQVVIELTSRSTRREDLGRKLKLYQEEGVLEYYLFDPRKEYLTPRFRAYHRHGSQLVSVLPATLEIFSPTLQLHVQVLRDELRFRTRDGRLVPTAEELLAEQEEILAHQEEILAQKEDTLAQKDEVIAQQARALQEALEELRRLKGG